MAERIPNPYRPGFNQMPVVFAGRADVLDGAAEALEVGAHDHRTPRPVMVVGPRGLGKTVTLGEIADLAVREYSWPTVHVEAKPKTSLLEELIVKVDQTAGLLEGEAPRPVRARARIAGGSLEAKAFGLGGSIDIERVDPSATPAQRLDAVLKRAATTAMHHGAGLVVTLDELQNAPSAELHILGSVLQERVPDGWPVVIAIAALPSLRTTRGAKKLPTYLERAEWHELEDLLEPEAREALTEPARLSGRPMTPAAADVLLERAGGYPYAIQVAGQWAWRVSAGEEQITAEHARAALPKIDKELVQLFKGRWADASPREQEYLQAMATAEQRLMRAPGGGDVAAVLGEPVTAVSYLRERLLQKGTIYDDGAGRLHFITPKMGDWILSAAAAP